MGHAGAIDANDSPGAPTSIFTGVTFSQNTAGNGGAVSFGTNNPASFVNSTFYGNASSGAGGGAAIYTYSAVSLTFSTVFSNTVGPGGGAAIGFNLGGPAALSLQGTILNNPTNCDTSKVPTDGGSNLTFGADDCQLFASNASDKLHVDPLLNPPASNGGTTQTVSMNPGSPAIDGAANCIVGSSALGTDQRGVPRPQGPACDIGAFELDAQSSVLTFPASGGVYSAPGWLAGCGSVGSGICGTASGVASVQVGLQNGAGNYWNGTSFVTSSTPLWVSATLSNSPGLGRTWFLPIAPPLSDVYHVSVQSQSYGGISSGITSAHSPLLHQFPVSFQLGPRSVIRSRPSAVRQKMSEVV